MKGHSKKAFTLVEVMVTIGIITIVIVNLLRSYVYSSTLTELSGNMSYAITKAQGKMEEIRNHNFETITMDYAPAGTPPKNIFALTKATDGVEGMGVITITDVDPGVTANLLQVEIVVCWRNKDGRIIGEDNGGTDPTKALNGALDSGFETDADGNTRISSPLTIISMIAKR